MISRDEIGHLCQEHDRFMAEAREWLRRSPVSESDTDGLIYKHYDNSAQAAVPVPEPEPFDAAQSDVLARVVAVVQDREQAELEKALAERDARITRLDGKVEALLALLGKSVNLPDLKSAEVVDLPKNFWRRDAA
jgi:hypothetical protein